MTEHTILVAFTVEGTTRKAAQEALIDALPDVALDLRSDHLTSWWIAEDDRTDRSDNDSAVFVTPGQQRRASILLNQEGLTEDCNVVPRIEDRVPDLDTESSASRQHFIDTGFYLRRPYSPFEVVGTGTYDADSDSLATAPAGWYVEIVRDEPFENILIGPFDTADEAEEHCESTDVEDWVTGEAKDKGYVVDDVKVVENPTLIPSYGVNAPVFPVYAEGACLGILPGRPTC